MPSQARTNSFWMPFGPRHPLKMVAQHRSTSQKNLFPPLVVKKVDQDVQWLLHTCICIFTYIYKKRERHTNSSMLVSSEASILRNQRFSIIINPRCARLLEEKIKGEGEKYKKKEIIKKKRK